MLPFDVVSVVLILTKFVVKHPRVSPIPLTPENIPGTITSFVRNLKILEDNTEDQQDQKSSDAIDD